MRSVVSVRQFVSPLSFKQKLTLALDFFACEWDTGQGQNYNNL